MIRLPLAEMTRTFQAADAGSRAAADVAKEGLPFWIFWLLLSIIVLLLFFILLRDKDMRERVSFFLSGAKRKMIRLRLQAKIKKEKARKNGLRKELGRAAWSEDIRSDATAEIFAKLDILCKETTSAQLAWQDVYSRIEAAEHEKDSLRKRLREEIDAEKKLRRPYEAEMESLASREKEIQSRRSRLTGEAMGSDGNPLPNLKAVEEEAAGIAASLAAVRVEMESRDRKIRGLEKTADEREKAVEKGGAALKKEKRSIEERIISLKNSCEPLYENIGKILDETRLDHKSLALFYFQIDSVNGKIQSLKEQHDRLS